MHMFSSRWVSVFALVLALVSSGCGKTTIPETETTPISQQPTFSYPFHLTLNVQSPQNAVSEIVADLWGVAVADRATGAVTGKGIILYPSDTTCAWSPPSPYEGVPPYCEVLSLTNGTFYVEGNIRGYTESRYSEELSALDAALFASGDAWGFEQAEWLPKALQLDFAYGETPLEHVLLSGLRGGGTEEKDLGGLAMGLDAVGFVRPFTVSPIMAPTTYDPAYEEVASSAKFQFSGDNGIASGSGTLFFVDALPESVAELLAE